MSRRKKNSAPVDFLPRIAERLRAARDAKGWTQDELAAEVTRRGMTLDGPQVSRIEKARFGLRGPSLPRLIAIGQALGLAPVDLLSDNR